MLLTIFKLIIIGIILLSLIEKHRAIKTSNKTISKVYFLSIQYFDDTYHSMELQTKSLHEWYAMSKLKFKSYKSFFQILILLSGDIAMNPGPTSFPCSKCSKGVRVGILCTNCDTCIHKICEGLSSSQMTKLSKNQTEMSKVVCIICKENMENLNSNENDLPANEISFQFQEEILDIRYFPR